MERVTDGLRAEEKRVLEAGLRCETAMLVGRPDAEIVARATVDRRGADRDGDARAQRPGARAAGQRRRTRRPARALPGADRPQANGLTAKARVAPATRTSRSARASRRRWRRLLAGGAPRARGIRVADAARAMRFVTLDEARSARGLRLVVTAGVPSPWSETAKSCFDVKGIDYLAVRLTPRDADIRAWTSRHNAPVAMYRRRAAAVRLGGAHRARGAAGRARLPGPAIARRSRRDVGDRARDPRRGRPGLEPPPRGDPPGPHQRRRARLSRAGGPLPRREVRLPSLARRRRARSDPVDAGDARAAARGRAPVRRGRRAERGGHLPRHRAGRPRAAARPRTARCCRTSGGRMKAGRRKSPPPSPRRWSPTATSSIGSTSSAGQL